jgi:HK97 family phage major capsid protein
MREVIQRLHEKRLNIRSQQTELMASIEGDLDNDGGGEAKAKWEEMDKEFADLGEAIDRYLTLQENEKDLDEQRQRFEKVVRDPRVVETSEQAWAEKARNWLRAGLPDAEVWAPRTLEIPIGSLAARPDRDGRIGEHVLTKGTATDGAELIPTGFVRTLQEHLIENNGVRRTNAQVFTTTSGENLLVPATTSHGAAALVAEGGTFAASDAQFKQVTMNAYKYGQLEQVSTELVQDSAVDLLDYLARAAGIAIGSVTETAFTTGTGSAQPEGFTLAGTAGVTGAAPAASTVPSADNLIDLYHSIVTGYRARAYWVMNDLQAARIRKLRDDSGGAGLGNFIWQPGLSAGQPDTIFGRPVVTCPAMASALAVNALLIAFGDFSAYYGIRDVNTVIFDRSDDFAFNTGLITFRSSVRTDGKQLINGAAGAVKFWKGNAA